MSEAREKRLVVGLTGAVGLLGANKLLLLITFVEGGAEHSTFPVWLLLIPLCLTSLPMCRGTVFLGMYAMLPDRFTESHNDPRNFELSGCLSVVGALYAVGLFIQGATCLGVEANDCPWNIDEWVIMIFALLLVPSYLGWLLAASEIYRLAKRRSETELHARNGGSFKPGVLDVAPPGPSAESDRVAGGQAGAVGVRTPVNNIEYFPPNFEGLVLGCIDADFCK